MKTQFRVLLCAGILLAILVTGCEQMTGLMAPTEDAPKATPNPLVIADTAITVEGRLVPKEWLQVSFATGGQIEEVYVSEGDLLNKGDVLASLKGREQLEAQLAAAEYELFAAEQALEQLYDELELKVLQNQALQAINNARQAVHDTERKARNMGGATDQTDVDLARTQVIFAEEELARAKERFQPYESKPETNLVRARLQVELANAQKAYDDAVRKYNALTGEVDDFDLNQAQTDYEVAKGQLEIAQEQYEKASAGPDPIAVENAEARIRTAEIQVAAAQARLDELDLVAPMAGILVESDLIVGKQVSPGVPLALISDFSEWYVETEDLTEIEVVDVRVGQQVTVVPDAIPDLELKGEVISISDTYEEKRGDITYIVRIKLEDFDSRLRWGMTVVVTFEENE